MERKPKNIMLHFSRTTFLKNELSAHLLIVITSKQNKLETRGWSQIKEVEKIFSDLMYFFKICLLVTNLWCG